MQISVSGKNMDTGAAFQSHAEDALNGVVNKYFERAVSGHVTLEKADSGFRVKTRVALSRRIELEATGFAQDAHMALEAAIEHAEKRLRRHKRRLKNHRGTVTQAEADEVLPAPMLVYASADQLSDAADDGDGEADMPAVVAELSYDIEMLTVEQAVMKLELSEAPMLMFRNAAHLGLNVVHRREDGSIGWVDPRGARKLNS
ncbi:MAG: ribosome hibernation-promoting factor, HPF/YfiA family [Candidatus Puniceispirillaceae bacterium]